MHERSTFLMWQSATQTVLAAVFVIAASPIAAGIGPANWYNLGAGNYVSCALFACLTVL
jgi:hypothetical protein